MRWDIFCRVIDNYGDAGVSWRLARQLASEHRLDVTLWIDRLATLARFEPAIDPLAAQQRCRGVTLHVLNDAVAAFEPAEVVIEGFGCGLPQRYLDAMEARDRPPLWFNLEYLSAEPWVDELHGLASQHPQRRLTRYFWFPGFTPKTGGLIREAGLVEARDAVQRAIQETRIERRGPAGPGSLAGGGTGGVSGLRTPELSILLFCYANRAVPTLLELWMRGDSPIRCVVPEGVAPGEIATWLGCTPPPAPHRVTRGALTLDLRPFCTQEEFDRMLWVADVNVVRGEDSFVRAQWAARPLLWQPYPQDDGAHVAKHGAFLARYLPDATDRGQCAFRRLAEAFCSEDGAATAIAWSAFRQALPALTAHASRWAVARAAQPDLASGLVAFAGAKL